MAESVNFDDLTDVRLLVKSIDDACGETGLALVGRVSIVSTSDTDRHLGDMLFNGVVETTVILGDSDD